MKFVMHQIKLLRRERERERERDKSIKEMLIIRLRRAAWLINQLGSKGNIYQNTSEHSHQPGPRSPYK